jgi:hypothetical protein
MRIYSYYLSRLLLVGLLFGSAGCASLSQPASASFASVIISGSTSEEIQTVTRSVFGDAGYKLASSVGDAMVFEREGSRMDHIAYGSAIANTPVWNRVRVSLVPFVSGTLRLQCQAYMVRDYGAGPMEEELKLLPIRAGPYQQLLESVAKRCALKSGV